MLAVLLHCACKMSQFTHKNAPQLLKIKGGSPNFGNARKKMASLSRGGGSVITRVTLSSSLSSLEAGSKGISP